MKRIKVTALLLLTICVPLMAGLVFLGSKLRFPEYTSAVYRESAAELNNPYAGWYQIYGYSLSDDGSPDLSQAEENPGPGLALLQFNLRNYADSAISDAGLRQLNTILKSWRAAERQLILRFLYDWEGNASETEPKTLSLILTHMSQTAEIINAYADCVYILQGLFVGNWGEMHGSDYITEADMLTLANHLASVTDPRIFLAVRTPEQWRVITGSSRPLSPQTAFDGSLAARLSLFNDGMLGSETDLGTYRHFDTPASPSDLEKRSRSAELLFQKALCAYVPNGGEVVAENPYNDFPAAVEDLACAHVSYLNSAYDEAVLSKWRNAVWQSGDVFDGVSGYDYISRHLGYRYCVRSSEFTFSPPWDDTASFSVLLENVGFSAGYRAFDVSLVLRHEKNGDAYVLPVQTDTRLWSSGAETLLEASFPIRALSAGTYEVFLEILDPVSGCRILLANEENDPSKGFRLGSLTIKKCLLHLTDSMSA